MTYRSDIYLGLDEAIDPSNYIIATFFLAGASNLQDRALELAAESSIGTWTEVHTLSPEIVENLAAKIVKIQDDGIIQVAYPLELFEGGNLPQLLSDVAGNVFGMKTIENLRLNDLDIPEDYAKTFPGPAFGIDGVRKAINAEATRPLVGTIIKPKLGLNSERHAQVAYEAWSGGLDFVKDDENLSNQTFNRFESRIALTLEKADLVYEETGRKVLYAANITAPADVMLERAEYVKAQGGLCIMMDVFTAGFSAVQYIRNQNLGLIIHAHRAMHGAFTRQKDHGITNLTFAKLLRLAGVDLLHTGTVVGKMEGDRTEVLELGRFLQGPFYGQKPVFPAASGGLHPGLLPALVDLYGVDVACMFGGGAHGHPQKTRAGARAIRQAVEAVQQNIPLATYAETHPELKIALEFWSQP